MIKKIFSYKIKRILDAFDIFRLPVTLFFNKSEKISTLNGKLITITIIGFLIYFASNSDLFQKINPQILSKDIKVDKRPTFFFDKSNFTFSVGLADSANNFMIDPAIYELSLVIFQQTGGYEPIIQKYPLILCQKKDFVLHPDQFEKQNLNGTYCLPDITLKIEGFWNEDTISYIYVDLNKCVNSSMNNNSCRTSEEINNFIELAYIDIYLENSYLDLTNFSEPFKQQLSIFYQKIDINLYKSIEFYLTSAIIRTDYGWFFEAFEFENNYYISNYLTDVGYYLELECLYSISIYSSDETNQITRKYQKLQDVLAQFGGVCNLLMIFGFFLSKLENSFNFSYEAMNKIYNFYIPESDENNKRKPQKQQTSIFPQKKRCNFTESKLALYEEKNIQNSSSKTILSNSSMSPKDKGKENSNNLPNISKNSLKFKTIKKPLEKLNFEKYKSFKLNKNNLKFSFGKYMKLLLKNKKYKLSDIEKLYVQAEEKIFQEFDIINIIMKLQDIDKLKKIFLTDSQLYFFDLLSKPTISLTNPIDFGSKKELIQMSYENFDILNKHKETKTIQKFYNSYQEMKLNSKNNLVDKKLIDMLDDDIVYVLNHKNK